MPPNPLIDLLHLLEHPFEMASPGVVSIPRPPTPGRGSTTSLCQQLLTLLRARVAAGQESADQFKPTELEELMAAHCGPRGDHYIQVRQPNPPHMLPFPWPMPRRPGPKQMKFTDRPSRIGPSA
jgi:hypothetical protein